VIRPAGMIWHIAGPPDIPSPIVRSEQPTRVQVLTPGPGLLFCTELRKSVLCDGDHLPPLVVPETRPTDQPLTLSRECDRFGILIWCSAVHAPAGEAPADVGYAYPALK